MWHRCITRAAHTHVDIDIIIHTMMQGTLIKYGLASSQIAFITPAKSGINAEHRHLALVGGLTDGFMFSSYVMPLAEALSDQGWSMVQVQLTSSYMGWGCSSLDEDAAELLQLCQCLHKEHDSRALVLMGHSTGCQDIVRLMQSLVHSSGNSSSMTASGEQVHLGGLPIKGNILQAAVSDREWLRQFPELEEVAVRARQLVTAGRAEDVVGRLQLLGGPPVTARRFCSLYDQGGDDDMFSTDLTDVKLQELLSPVGVVPCLVLSSGSDEAVPSQAGIPAHSQRLAVAISSKDGSQPAKSVIVPGAPHNCEGHEAVVVQEVLQFISTIGGPKA